MEEALWGSTLAARYARIAHCVAAAQIHALLLSHGAHSPSIPCASADNPSKLSQNSRDAHTPKGVAHKSLPSGCRNRQKWQNCDVASRKNRNCCGLLNISNFVFLSETLMHLRTGTDEVQFSHREGSRTKLLADGIPRWRNNTCIQSAAGGNNGCVPE